MLRLVETDVAAAGELDPGDRTPASFLDIGARHAFLRKRGRLGLQVVTHEIEFLPVILLVRMERDFSGRQSKNEPSMAGIYGTEAKDIPKERAVSCRVFAVHDDVRTEDHEPTPFSHLQYSRGIGGIPS
jgi:hypothetical protein